jgi:hypothetical protein
VDDDDDLSQTFLHYSFPITLCRLVGGLMLPSQMTIGVGLELLCDEDEDIGFALNKIQHWMENYVERSIAVSCMNTEGFAVLLDDKNTPRLENKLMVTAQEPTDHHMMFIFQSKINALAAGAFVVTDIEIESSDSQGLRFTFVGASDGQLPDMSEWIPGPNWFDEPWWDRDDVSMIDTVAPEGADLTVRPTWAQTLDFLRESVEDQPAVIIPGDWEPRIIDPTKDK